MRAALHHSTDRLEGAWHALRWAPPLLARLTVGLTFAVTGWGKLHNLDGVTQYFASLGIPAAGFQAAVVATTELVCGGLLVAGLLTRLAALPLIVVMVVAIATAKWPEIQGAVDLAGTLEATYIAVLSWLGIAGAGALSLDHLVARRLSRTDPPPTGETR